MIDFIVNVSISTWALFLDSAVYILAGLILSGMLRVFLSPEVISGHLGKGRFLSVFKAAILGVPLPLCSCGVLPAAVTLKKQGANNGATTAFLISTPESGVDSISVTYALLDPIMTIARPVAAFVMALTAGIVENIFPNPTWNPSPQQTETCVSECHDGCCDRSSPIMHDTISLPARIRDGLTYAVTDVWDDIVGWFFIGLVLAGMITTLVPDDFMAHYLGGGIGAMLIMLAAGIPLYICATASTPVAAALIMKGVSPGAALIFLLAGPATNMASLTVLTGVLGKRTMTIYLMTIACFSVLFGIMVDHIYVAFGISPTSVVGTAAEVVPLWLQVPGVIILLLISLKPITNRIQYTITRLIRVFSAKPLSDSDSEDRRNISCAGST